MVQIEFKVREATPSDADSISEVLEAAFDEYRSLYTPAAFLATVPPSHSVLIRMREGRLWVAERDGALIGTVGVTVAEDSVIVRGMAVHPLARGLGAGKTLLRVTEDFARRAGIARLVLYTTPFLKEAIRLYESSGFQFTGDTVSPDGTMLLRMMKQFQLH